MLLYFTYIRIVMVIYIFYWVKCINFISTNISYLIFTLSAVLNIIRFIYEDYIIANFQNDNFYK